MYGRNLVIEYFYPLKIIIITPLGRCRARGRGSISWVAYTALHWAGLGWHRGNPGWECGVFLGILLVSSAQVSSVQCLGCNEISGRVALLLLIAVIISCNFSAADCLNTSQRQHQILRSIMSCWMYLGLWNVVIKVVSISICAMQCR